MVKWIVVEQCTGSLFDFGNWKILLNSSVLAWANTCPCISVSSLYRQPEFGTFHFMMPLKRAAKCFCRKHTDIVVVCSSSTPTEPHHNIGRCSQIPSRLPREAHRLLILFKNGALDLDVFELGCENPADAVMMSAVDDWLKQEHMYACIPYSPLMCCTFFFFFLFCHKTNTDMSNLMCFVCSHVSWLLSHQ